MKQSGNDNSSGEQDFKEQSIKYNLSKFDFELFDEEKNVPGKIIRVSRVGSKDTEKWKIYDNNKVIFILEAAKISKKEKEYLRSIDGIKFLIDHAKHDIKSLNSLRVELKKVLK